ncbi:hypothetical protein [Sphingobacterium yanglingense]|uniref:Uncharacterized protein n=1 Tax=Sphingobacterium yanglingense TaxID=1437280 RepID=A0A4R6WNB0_9SPHI|nr:hypothetical protein [Sphingobacterium yanglingense]TDQ79591.1 hypothetical protein CLV99_1036 [Sphingobacterium yanglingense]
MNKTDKKRVFGFKELGMKDLEGGFTPFVIDQKTADNGIEQVSLSVKIFANTIYRTGSKSIDMDNFLRDLHANGEAELTDAIAVELIEASSQLWSYPVIREINLLIEKSK